MQLNGDSLIWALSALAQLNPTPFDPKLILQQFAPPYSTQTLHEAASHFGLKVGFKQVQARELNQLSLPCLAVLEPVALPAIGLPQAAAQSDPKVIPLTSTRAVDAAPTDAGAAAG